MILFSYFLPRPEKSLVLGLFSWAHLLVSLARSGNTDDKLIKAPQAFDEPQPAATLNNLLQKSLWQTSGFFRLLTLHIELLLYISSSQKIGQIVCSC